MTNGSADVSKTISHGKMLNYSVLVGITVNNYNLPRSLKGGGVYIDSLGIAYLPCALYLSRGLEGPFCFALKLEY